jgi:hypothetical protein
MPYGWASSDSSHRFDQVYGHAADNARSHGRRTAVRLDAVSFRRLRPLLVRLPRRSRVLGGCNESADRQVSHDAKFDQEDHRQDHSPQARGPRERSP